MDHLVGKRIRLIEMPKDPCPVPPGTEGTVEEVTVVRMRPQWTQIWVKWDNGRTLSMAVPPDRFEVI
jgi:hypothetical protein